MRQKYSTVVTDLLRAVEAKQTYKTLPALRTLVLDVHKNTELYIGLNRIFGVLSCDECLRPKLVAMLNKELQHAEHAEYLSEEFNLTRYNALIGYLLPDFEQLTDVDKQALVLSITEWKHRRQL